MSDPTQARAIAVLARVLGTHARDEAAGLIPAMGSSWNAARHIDLVVALENEFGCEFEDGDLPALTRIDRIGEIVAKRSASR